ncbi:hypothetical protein J6590_019476 [Homalodisca vitripennis]|nr:hypothetical protein J6590_019476 [Homalodisca vitripennis]
MLNFYPLYVAVCTKPLAEYHVSHPHICYRWTDVISAIVPYHMHCINNVRSMTRHILTFATAGLMSSPRSSHTTCTVSSLLPLDSSIISAVVLSNVRSMTRHILTFATAGLMSSPRSSHTTCTVSSLLPLDSSIISAVVLSNVRSMTRHILTFATAGLMSSPRSSHTTCTVSSLLPLDSSIISAVVLSNVRSMTRHILTFATAGLCHLRDRPIPHALYQFATADLDNLCGRP